MFKKRGRLLVDDLLGQESGDGTKSLRIRRALFCCLINGNIFDQKVFKYTRGQ